MEYVFFGILVILISYLMIFSESKIFILKPTAIFFILFVVMYYIGVILYTSGYAPLVLVYSTESQILINFTFASFSILFFSLGAYLPKLALKIKNTDFNYFFYNKKYGFEFKGRKFFVLIIAFFISVLLCLFHFYKAGVPILSTDPNMGRINFIRGYGYFFIFNSLFNHMVCFAGYYLSRNNNKYWRLIFTIGMVFSMVLSWATLFKSSVVVQFLILFLIHKTINHGLPDAKNLVKLGVLLFLTLFALIFLVSDDFTVAFNYLIYRVFLINTYDTVTIINAIESGALELYYGSAILKDIAANKPGPEMSFQGEMYSYIYNNGVEAGINASYAQLFADFSWAGVFVYFSLGLLFEIFYLKFFLLKRTLNVDSFVFYAFLCYGLANSVGYLTKGVFNWTLPIFLFYCLYKFVIKLVPSK
jgi:oligosaccharide repeat unit polymerase